MFVNSWSTNEDCNTFCLNCSTDVALVKSSNSVTRTGIFKSNMISCGFIVCSGLGNKSRLDLSTRFANVLVISAPIPFGDITVAFFTDNAIIGVFNETFRDFTSPFGVSLVPVTVLSVTLLLGMMPPTNGKDVILISLRVNSHAINCTIHSIKNGFENIFFFCTLAITKHWTVLLLCARYRISSAFGNVLFYLDKILRISETKQACELGCDVFLICTYLSIKNLGSYGSRGQWHRWLWNDRLLRIIAIFVMLRKRNISFWDFFKFVHEILRLSANRKFARVNCTYWFSLSSLNYPTIPFFSRELRASRPTWELSKLPYCDFCELFVELIERCDKWSLLLLSCLSSLRVSNQICVFRRNYH